VSGGAPAALPTWRFAWRSGPLWESSAGTRLVGIVNVTPDSFTDGGAHLAPADAAAHAVRLVEEGADALDVGAESTRPGHVPLAAEEEWRRLGPALARIRAAVSVPLSVDTRHAAVAARALDAGAQAVNDVSGLGDPEMVQLVCASGAPIILGHWRPGRAGTWTAAAVLSDLLAERQRLLDAGVGPERVAVDPGLGFGKRGEDNWRIVAALPALVAAGPALMLGPSRKRFLAAAAGLDAMDAGVRDELTAYVTMWAALTGVALVRVHAPAPSRRALAIATAVRAGGAGWTALPGMDA
jgi:dihydropteroate synthase